MASNTKAIETASRERLGERPTRGAPMGYPFVLRENGGAAMLSGWNAMAGDKGRVKVDDPVYGTMTAADGTVLRTAIWSGPVGAARATVVLLTGRAEFIEKYRETAAELTRRGFRVVQMDWRNQGLSGRPLANRQIHHLRDFTVLRDDLALLVERVALPVADGGPLMVMAHSMGGLVAVLHMAAAPDLYAAAVLSAPMIAVHLGGLPRWLARGLAAGACALGLAERYGPGQGDYDPRNGVFTPDNPITSDPRRYALFHGPLRDRPELRVGGVSFGWLDAAFRAERAVLGSLPLERVRTPLLVLTAPADRVVDSRAAEAMARRFPNAAVCRYPDARHEVLMETDAVRDRVWADIGGFLDQHFPLPAVAPVTG